MGRESIILLVVLAVVAPGAYQLLKAGVQGASGIPRDHSPSTITRHKKSPGRCRGF
jgi:hypothetical protein